MKHYDMRRADRAMDERAMHGVLARGAYCTVATTDADGMPYAVPLSYVYVPAKGSCRGRDAGHLGSAEAPCGGQAAGHPDSVEGSGAHLPAACGTMYVHTTNEGGHKLDNFARDARVCATVVEGVSPLFDDGFTTNFSSVMAFGRIRRVENPVEVRHALVDLCMKYLPEHKAKIGEAMAADIEATAVWAIEIETLTGKARRSVSATRR